jgi:hypothetical protein
MGKPRKGRKTRSTKRNSDYWFNPATGRQELKPNVLAKKRAMRVKTARENKANIESEKTEVIVKQPRRVSKPCCIDQVALNQKNESMLEELFDNPVRAYDPVTLRPDVIVIQPWFTAKYLHHMPHFRQYLAVQNIRTTG